MREAVLLTSAASCALLAELFGKTPDTDWWSALVSIVLAGSAGVLLVLAVG